MHPRRVVVLTAVIVLAACASPADDGAARTTSDVAATDHSPASSMHSTAVVDPSDEAAQSTTSGPVGEGPVWPPTLVYGWDGIARTDGSLLDLLVAEPVMWAVDDGMGGVLFRSVAEQPGYAWLRTGADRPERIDLGTEGWPHLDAVWAEAGTPMALVSRSGHGGTMCIDDELATEMSIRNLVTGDERFLMCHGEGSDGGEGFTSFGGGLFSAVRWVAVGASSSSAGLSFYDGTGSPVEVPHNPFPDSCAPCTLSAHLSPDGTRLAYAHWPTAFWGQPQPADDDVATAVERWRAQADEVPTRIVVMDLATGAEIFSTEEDAATHLDGFDGRHLHVASDTHAALIDTTTGGHIDVPRRWGEPIGFWGAILESLDVATTTYDEAQSVAGQLAVSLGEPTGVVWSEGYVTLNPGYWAVYAGHFANQADAAAACRELEVPCYPRYVATVDTIHPTVGRAMLTLEPDGLGLVSFGAERGEVVALLDAILGSPPPDSGEQADWVEYVCWSDFGLCLGFSLPAWEQHDGVSRFVGWRYWGSDRLELGTASGTGPGMTVVELQDLHDDVEIVVEMDGCVDRMISYAVVDSILVMFDDDDEISWLMTGLGVGC